jgi:hypothetical protein
MVRGVPVALLRTGEAGDGTGFDHCADEAQIRRGLAGHDAAGRVAGVGAVDAETNAAHHLPHVVLGEIGVGTTRTAGGTIEALGDAAQERVTIEACRLWMQLKDLLEGHLSPFVWLELTYQKLQIPDKDGQTLVVYHAAPGSASADRQPAQKILRMPAHRPRRSVCAMSVIMNRA